MISTFVSSKLMIHLARLVQATADTAGGTEGGADPSSAPPPPDFQPYIFWAYGLVCVLLFAFTLWTMVETRRLGRHLEYLRERFERSQSHKEAAESAE